MKISKFIAPVEGVLVQEISELMDELHLCTSTNSNEELFRTKLRELLFKHQAHSKKTIPELIVWLNSHDAQKYAQINRDFTIRVLFDEQEQYYRINECAKPDVSTDNYQINAQAPIKKRNEKMMFIRKFFNVLGIRRFFVSTPRRAIEMVKNPKYRRELIKEINGWVDEGPSYRRYAKKLLQVAYRVCVFIWPALKILNMMRDLVSIITKSNVSECDENQNSI